MALMVDIDSASGFCPGVTRAIETAESFLAEAPQGERLYSLGAIVHNEMELARLQAKGLVPIDVADLDDITGAAGRTLLVRAHGEPPSTYTKAYAAGFNIIDCTCGVVLNLQKEIRKAWDRLLQEGRGGQIVIFGKMGHPEVLGLQGQIKGNVLVVENMRMLEEAVSDGRINLLCPVEIFSQTTKSPAEYAGVCYRLEEMMARENEMAVKNFRGRGLLRVHRTICAQVEGRHQRLSDFALSHDVIVFVAGKSSSNGKVLCDLCKSLNIRTYYVSKKEEVKQEWFRGEDRVGVCGATSTPKWLLEEVANEIEKFG